MTIFKLNFTVKCDRIKKVNAGLIPELLAQNPFGACTRFLDDSNRGDSNEQEFQPQILQQIISKYAQWNLTLFNPSTTNPLTVDLLQKSHGAMLSITVGDAQLKHKHERFLAYVRLCIKSLPEVAQGYIFDPDFDIDGLYRVHNIEQPPACFTTHLRWVHFLGPRLYSLYFTKEDLLKTPAYKVEQVDEGIIEVMNYEDPFDCGSPATQEKLIAITEYLNDKDHFMKNP